MESSPMEKLTGDWVHSHEEDGPGRQVFRPADHPFPPSRRPRRSLTLTPDGGLVEGIPGPDDRRRRESGTWSLDGHRLTLLVSGRQDRELEIEDLADDRLVVREPTGG